MPAVAMTDHGNLYGALSFYYKMRDAGVKPIIGMEGYIARGSRLEKGGGAPLGPGERATNHIVLLAKNLTGQADATAKFIPIIGMRHIVELNARCRHRIRGPQCYRSARFAAHRADMGLKSMPRRHCTAIIAHRDGQEVILNVRIINTGL